MFIRPLCTAALVALLLQEPAASVRTIGPDQTWTLQNYLHHSKAVVLVCHYRHRFFPANRGGYHELHTSSTVVRIIKGTGTTGDRLQTCELYEEIPPAGFLGKYYGSLSYLFLEEYTTAPILLGTGDSWRHTPELEALVTSMSASGEFPPPPED